MLSIWKKYNHKVLGMSRNNENINSQNPSKIGTSQIRQLHMYPCTASDVSFAQSLRTNNENNFPIYFTNKLKNDTYELPYRPRPISQLHTSIEQSKTNKYKKRTKSILDPIHVCRK